MRPDTYNIPAQLEALRGQTFIGGIDLDDGQIALRIGDRVVMVRGTVTVLDDFRSASLLERLFDALSPRVAAARVFYRGESRPERIAARESAREPRRLIKISDDPSASDDLDVPDFMRDYDPTGEINLRESERRTRSAEIEEGWS